MSKSKNDRQSLEIDSTLDMTPVTIKKYSYVPIADLAHFYLKNGSLKELLIQEQKEINNEPVYEYKSILDSEQVFFVYIIYSIIYKIYYKFLFLNAA